MLEVVRRRRDHLARIGANEVVCRYQFPAVQTINPEGGQPVPLGQTECPHPGRLRLGPLEMEEIRECLRCGLEPPPLNVGQPGPEDTHEGLTLHGMGDPGLGLAGNGRGHKSELRLAGGAEEVLVGH